MRARAPALLAAAIGAIFLTALLLRSYEGRGGGPPGGGSAFPEGAATSGVLGALEEGDRPLAFRYRGKLCSVRGCLLETVVDLCASSDLHQLLVRVTPLPGGLRTRAILIAIPWPMRRWEEQTIVELASQPLTPRRVWLWSGPLPKWEDWCHRVAG